MAPKTYGEVVQGRFFSVQRQSCGKFPSHLAQREVLRCSTHEGEPETNHEEKIVKHHLIVVIY